MPTTTGTRTVPVTVTPYLAVHDGAAALAFYHQAFGAIEVMRIAGDDGKLGHAEFTVGRARFYLSDEFPDLGVVSPRTLGGTAVTLHLEVEDVDQLFAAAVTAGATALRPPADQPHGARHGTLADPFGHRWMLSQTVEDLSDSQLAARMADDGWSVETGPAAQAAGAPAPGGIWAAINAADAPALIRFLDEVLGFEPSLVVPGEEAGVVAHSEIRWPEGGVVQVSTANRPGNVFSQRPVGGENLYVITAHPDRVHQRCVAAGATVVLAPHAPDYDPSGSMFTVTDPEGNLWTFGTYRGEA